MRPLRGLLACLGILVLLTIVLAIRHSTHNLDGPAVADESRRSRLRALFSFHTPDSLFPPSAIISLTDDNSTFFVARPAAYGPSFPSGGLSGQLWVGSGFGDDTSAHGGTVINAKGELGCSDIPGWPYTGPQDKNVAGGKDKSKDKAHSKQPARSGNTKPPAEAPLADSPAKAFRKEAQAPQAKDGTDDHLHWPLKGAALIKGLKLPEKEQDSADTKDKEHADIQSLQESAEIAGKVVLLSRGGCGFLEKTKWVQRRGGVALIVGDNIRGEALVNMYASGDTSNVTIPSIFTSHMSAHLLSSLIPPGAYLNSALAPDTAIPAKAPAAEIKKDPKKQPRPAEQDAKSTTGSSSTSSVHESPSWISRLAKALGIRGRGGPSDDRRFPNSGRISWVQSDNWDEDVNPRRSKETKQVADGKNFGNVKDPAVGKQAQPGPGTEPGSGASSGFVIGVHDWRDTDLVALQEEQKQGTRTRSFTSTSTSTAEPKATSDGKGKTFAGGNVVPGSGRYSVPVQGAEQMKAAEKEDDGQADKEATSWLGRLFSSDDAHVNNQDAEFPSTYKGSLQEIPPIPPLVNTPGPREGLWVTITPTTMSSSPFFDTLLVLVVSPLVTLTVVYALLLLRARIQRRRWRAPKSVVERLPVRVYHTMSSSSISTSSQTPSTETSSASSPLLQPEHSSTLSRTRPRSRTTTSINDSPALTLERQRGDLAARYEKKKYKGRQVECVVCLEEYVDGQSQVMSLPCGHEFHAECITPWLTTRRRTCPICKGDVVRSLAVDSESRAAVTATRSARSTDRASTRSSTRSRSESRNSRSRLLGDDLEQGRGASLPQSRFSLRSLTGWWSRRSTRDTASYVDRDR